MRRTGGMTALSVTAITNFLWAGETFFAAGFLLGRAGSLRSAAGLWALAMLCMGVGALAGGIDHGFLEPLGNTPCAGSSKRARTARW